MGRLAKFWFYAIGTIYVIDIINHTFTGKDVMDSFMVRNPLIALVIWLGIALLIYVLEERK